MQVFIGLGADLMLENGLKMAFSDFISVLAARQQPHLHIFTIDLACSLQLAVARRPVRPSGSLRRKGELVDLDLADKMSKDSGFLLSYLY